MNDRGDAAQYLRGYLDFELEIREALPQGYCVAIDSPAGEAEEEISLPFDRRELRDKLKDLEIALLRSGGTRRALSSEENTVQEFGQSLFKAVFPGKVGTCFYMSLEQARQQDKGLRLKLHVQPPELSTLPWEFLYDPDRDYLCFSRDTPIVRYTNLRQPVRQLAVEPPLRILGLVASPRGLAPLNVEHEKELMDEAIEGLQAEGLVELTWLEGQSWRELMREMRRGGPWHIFHFVGHGDFDPRNEEGLIALTDQETGREALLRARDLARLLDGHRTLRLVFLNSCEGARGSEGDPFSGTAATLVRHGIPAVVAMQYQITDGAAIEFSRNFYEAVADGWPVDAAVTEARVAVSMDSMLEWGTPVLYMRSHDGRLFDISTEAPLADSNQGETEDREKEDSLRRYRESVQWAWADEELHSREVERLQDLANNQFGLSPSIAADIERDVMGETIEGILERQKRAAREEEQKERLERLYTQAHKLHQDRDWQAVVEAFEQIHAENLNYPDPERLLRSAREGLEAQKLARRVAAIYAEGQRHMDAGECQQALECLEEVQRLKPGYRDTGELLSRVRRELAQPQMVEVPDVSGQEVPQASSTLAIKRLKLGVQNEVSSDTVSKGRVIKQSPASGARAAVGSSVGVTLSSGPQKGQSQPPRTSSATRSGSSDRDAREQHEEAIRDTERADTLDAHPQPLLNTLAVTWWALALRGLALGAFGLLFILDVTASLSTVVDSFVYVYGTLMLADGVLAIVVSRTTGRRSLLRIQGIISVSAGLAALPPSFRWNAIALWAICLGFIHIIVALRLGWRPKIVWPMAISGALLVFFGVLVLMFIWSTILETTLIWLFGIWPLASGVSLAAFALRVRNWEENRAR